MNKLLNFSLLFEWEVNEKREQGNTVEFSKLSGLRFFDRNELA